MKRIYKISEGSLAEKFHASRSKVQYYGGGFANGKTASACIKALQMARDYPGSNGLIARSTYPKLNDTIRKEFLKWCPSKWIKSFPQSANSTNTCTLTNGTMINFRYIQQQGKSNESSTSNLLSATYDWIIVDQIEDPEICHKDFLDLLGRLRGATAKYIGSDPSMPEDGPRWLIMTSNPTRNWVYRKIIKPFHLYQTTGQITEDLLADKDKEGNFILDENGKPSVWLEVFEGSTYENEDNLSADFIKLLESAYTGQMKERYLLGLWGAYEGLVYPEYDETVHMVPREDILKYLFSSDNLRYKLSIIEGYDHGIAKPACYLFGLIDCIGRVFIIDGFYEAELSPEIIINKIKSIRQIRVGFSDNEIMRPWADPSIFRRGGGEKKVVGKKLSDIFIDKDKEGNTQGIVFRRANNDIINGITKVKNYLTIYPNLLNPFTGEAGSPMIYFAQELTFISNEIADYFWQKDTSGEYTDTPKDVNDHAMDSIKYLLSMLTTPAELIKSFLNIEQHLNTWTEHPDSKGNRKYG